VSATHLEDFELGEVIESAETYDMTAERIEALPDRQSGSDGDSTVREPP